jgi:DNA-binding CsgD family transcriptional regulator
MLDTAAMANATFAAALDQLATPVLLVTADLRIVHANPAARSLTAYGESLRAVQGVLVAANGAVNTALTVAVRQASQDQSQLARRGLGIPMRGKDDAAAALHVLPLRPSGQAGEALAVAAVFVASADTPFVPPSEVVAALFDLTPAEARVFSYIAQGETLEGAAKILGVQRSTAKTHLLRIYDKMGVSRQADLIRIAMALNAPIMS